MEKLGAKLAFAHIAYGMNADDTRDFRPGQRAAEQHAVLAPLGRGRADEARSARAGQGGRLPGVGPSGGAVPFSRVEYGRTVTREVLEQVERGEESLRQLGFRELRVRHHGELARVEIARNELPRALTMEMMDAITAALKQAGFKYVTLDCAGFPLGVNECGAAGRGAGAAGRVRTSSAPALATRRCAKPVLIARRISTRCGHALSEAA